MTKDMTTGPITPLLVNFTIPLVLGNLFQLTYNAVDSIIVGKFVGEDALAAVGTSNPLMTLAILFINGVCLGAGILVSTAFGAGDTRLVERQVSTTAIAGSVFSLVFSLACVILANPLLRLLQVPEEILPIAVNYLRIVFGGLLFTFFYNFLAATMRALGDSKSALYFLMISSVLNIGGDLFFVEVLDWGSEGCALSTVLSEALCCVFCLIYIRWKVPVLQLGRRWFIFDSSLLKKTISYGWTSAMQQATFQLGKSPVQVNEAAGFVVNRILIPMINEAAFIKMEGVSDIAGIDTAMKLGANHPMGPLELRVAEVRACENLKESKKLLHLTVFDGERERCILSGIAKWFKPEDLIGKKIGIVCNLAPRPMMKGKYVSEGMIFAADTADGGCSIAFYGDDVPVGSRIH